MDSNQYESLIKEIEDGKRNGKCNFIEGNDPYNLNLYKFETYVQNTFDGHQKIEILEIFGPSCQNAKRCNINIDYNIIIEKWICPFIDKVYGVDQHITKIAEDVPATIPKLPEKKDIISLFGRALTCLGYLRGHF
jgi:hypothetical protein